MLIFVLEPLSGKSIDKTRDFQTLDEMNQALVDNINTFVGEDDILIHLGDFSFNGFDNIEKFRSQLNVKPFIVIRQPRPPYR